MPHAFPVHGNVTTMVTYTPVVVLSVRRGNELEKREHQYPAEGVVWRGAGLMVYAIVHERGRSAAWLASDREIHTHTHLTDPHALLT